MKQRGQRFVIMMLAAALSVGGSLQSVRAQDCTAKTHTEPGLMTADVALARPVGAVATVTGFAIYLISSPFSALGGNSKEAWQSLVASPANYTFKRPLGHFDCEPQPKVVK
jgi:hypothetical protein